MPKRLPSGKTKRNTKPARARVSQRPIAPAAATPDEAAPASPPVSSPSSAARRPAAPARQSLLNTVRRPAAKPGPTLTTDYSYVISDLKRIGVVSAGVVVILIALSFVIH